MPSSKEKNNAYCKAHYRKYAERYRQKRRTNNAIYRKRNRRYVAEYLSAHPCVDCGETDIIVLEFDHVRDTKYKEVSRLVTDARPIAVIAREIEKCEVRCCNCHRRVTHYRKYPKPLGERQ